MFLCFHFVFWVDVKGLGLMLFSCLCSLCQESKGIQGAEGVGAVGLSYLQGGLDMSPFQYLTEEHDKVDVGGRAKKIIMIFLQDPVLRPSATFLSGLRKNKGIQHLNTTSTFKCIQRVHRRRRQHLCGGQHCPPGLRVSVLHASLLTVHPGCVQCVHYANCAALWRSVRGRTEEEGPPVVVTTPPRRVWQATSTCRVVTTTTQLRPREVPHSPPVMVKDDDDNDEMMAALRV